MALNLAASAIAKAAQLPTNTLHQFADSPFPGQAFAADANNPAARTAYVTLRPPTGIFAEVPGATPKYDRNIGAREADYRETMARMFIQVSNAAEYQTFMASVRASHNVDTLRLAQVLVGTQSGQYGHGYIDFLLQQAQHAINEKFEVVELLSDNYASYFFGRLAPTFSYSGMLINTVQDDQTMKMFNIYTNLVRGSMMAKRGQVVRIRYDSMVVIGVFCNLQWSLQSDNETANPFSFNLLVKQIQVMPNNWYGLTLLDTAFDATGEVSPQTGALTAATGALTRSAVPSGPLSSQIAAPTNTDAITNATEILSDFNVGASMNAAALTVVETTGAVPTGARRIAGGG